MVGGALAESLEEYWQVDVVMAIPGSKGQKQLETLRIRLDDYLHVDSILWSSRSDIAVVL